MLTDSVKAPLKLEELPEPLTVIKELHKDNLRNATLNAYWMLVKCLQLLPEAKESSCKAKDTESGSNTGGYS